MNISFFSGGEVKDSQTDITGMRPLEREESESKRNR
jgi:hypothetical protein